LANVNPEAVTTVNTKNPDRAPLLLVGASNDHTVPASTVRAVKKLYKAGGVDHKQYEGRSHYIFAESGWEDIADDALAWARDAIAA
jgi:non-heme chloroperoxidase